MPKPVIRGLLLLAACGILLPAARCADTPAPDRALRIVRVFTGWREAASFKRISEYFSGRENTGGEIVRRTHPDQRGGYYFLVRIANPGAAVSGRIVLQIVTPDSATPRIFTFEAGLPGGESVFDLGLTGPDWPDRKINAVAWRLELDDEAGRVLATDQSFLWDRPAGE